MLLILLGHLFRSLCNGPESAESDSQHLNVPLDHVEVWHLDVSKDVRDCFWCCLWLCFLEMTTVTVRLLFAFVATVAHGLLVSCYLCVGCAGVAPPESRVTACVLQAEAGLVSLGYFTSGDGVQQVVVAEGVHAVVVPEDGRVNCVEKNENFRNNFKVKKKTLLSQLNFEGVVFFLSAFLHIGCNIVNAVRLFPLRAV